MNFQSSREETDPQDFLCPITFQEYTPENFPVTLPCGHTLSLEGFQSCLNYQRACPIRLKHLPLGYKPEKNYLLMKILDSKKANCCPKCSNHKKENAIVICTNHKAHLCVKCLRKDKCPDENIIPRERFHAYLMQEVTKMNKEENVTLEGTLSDVKISEDSFSSITSLLVDIAKWELFKQYSTENFREKKELMKQILDYEHTPSDKKLRKVLDDVELYDRNFKSLSTQEQVEKRTLEANKIVSQKLISLFREEPIKISIDNSLKEMKKNIDKDLCEKLELYFKEGFSNREEFFSRFEELENLESLSLQNLVTFENFGAEDIEKLTPIFQKLTFLNLDFAGLQKSRNEASGLEELLTSLEENKSIKTLQLSFKESNFASEEDFFSLYGLLLDNENLTSATLDFEKCQELTNSAIQKLLELANNFKEFNLNLLHCSHLTQKTMKKLTKCFWQEDTSMNFLKTLTLKLGHSQHISNSWLQSFSDYLRKMRILNLTLHFQGCPEIENRGVNHLFSAISQIECLKELSLSFIDCKKLSGAGVLKRLSKTVKRLNNLKILMLYIKGCHNFYFEDLEKFRNQVKNVTVVELDCPVLEKKKDSLE